METEFSKNSYDPKNNDKTYKLTWMPNFGSTMKDPMKPTDEIFIPMKTINEDVKDIYIQARLKRQIKGNEKGLMVIYIETTKGTYQIHLKSKNVQMLRYSNVSQEKYNFYVNYSKPPKVLFSPDPKYNDGEINHYHYFLHFLNFFNKQGAVNHVISNNGTCKPIAHEPSNGEKRILKDYLIFDQSRNVNLEEIASSQTGAKKKFYRLDSFFCCRNEFKNFYLLNLVIKLKIDFGGQENMVFFVNYLGLLHYIQNKSNVSIRTLKTEKDLNAIHNQINQKTLSFYKAFNTFHFNLQYSILSLITNKRINILDFNIDFITKKLYKIPCINQERAALVIENITSDPKVTAENYKEFFTQKWKDFKNLKMTEILKQDINLMKTKTIYITPNLIHYDLTKKEKPNHILRKYNEYAQNFIKVNFVNENKNRSYYNHETKLILINFLYNFLRYGIKVGTRHFDFLSSSNSQMKNTSFWFINLEGTKFQCVEQIIRELGDFTKEQNIQKNAARRGQCLSTTTYVKTLEANQIELIDDIERNDYVFTDGIGQISLDLAKICAEKFKLSISSAFQIRIGGVKGILALNPFLKGEKIIIRPSMLKFQSEDREFGVIRCATFSQGYLNRQIIILLSSLGVPNEIFFALLNKSLYKISALKDLNNTSSYYINDTIKKIYHFKTIIENFIKREYSINEDPLIGAVVKTILYTQIFDMKQKGRIFEKKSAILIGVIDETNTLEENEIYFRIKKDSCSKKNIENNDDNIINYEGKVIVTKNPCLHPGDIKILKAVKNEHLSHMVNVVVFSSKGSRPICNEISGGDLDGDLYYICWNMDIISHITEECQSLEETKPKSKSKEQKEISMKDIVKAYLDYMRHDIIGLIANKHAAIADRESLGAFHPNCLKLAELHSIAIDAAKHGTFVDFNDIDEIRANRLPDFLEVDSLDSYESPGILGQLYRRIDLTEHYNDLIKHLYYYCYLEDYHLNIDFISKNFVVYLMKAYDIYQKYSNDIYHLMNVHKSSSEAELFLNEITFERKKIKLEKFNDRFKMLQEIEDKYFRLITKVTGNEYDFASACYFVCYVNDNFYETDLAKFFLKNSKSFHNFTEKLIKDKRINYEMKNGKIIKLNSAKMTLSDFKEICQNRRRMNFNEFLKLSRVFSFPWFIKRIRDRLLCKNFSKFNY